MSPPPPPNRLPWGLWRRPQCFISTVQAADNLGVNTGQTPKGSTTAVQHCSNATMLEELALHSSSGASQCRGARDHPDLRENLWQIAREAPLHPKTRWRPIEREEDDHERSQLKGRGQGIYNWREGAQGLLVVL